MPSTLHIGSQRFNAEDVGQFTRNEFNVLSVSHAPDTRENQQHVFPIMCSLEPNFTRTNQALLKAIDSWLYDCNGCDFWLMISRS